MSVIRSLLYVPGDRPDRVVKALATTADAVLVDLEDAVALAAKPFARQVMRDTLRERATPGPALWVRINAGDLGRADLAAIAGDAGHLDGVVLAKCDDTGWLDEIAAAFPDSVALAPLVESASAVRHLDVLCAHPRVVQCHLGEIDLLADLGAHPDAAPALLGHARVELMYASAAADILPPIGGVYTDVADLDSLAADSVGLARLGFAGRPALHPSQVSVINAAFEPSVEEVAAASKLVATYDDALRRGIGVVTDDTGRMIDEAVVRRARRILASTLSNTTSMTGADP